MEYKLADIIDITKLQKLMEAFYLATNISSGIIDVEGNKIACCGWQDICTNFYQKNPSAKVACWQRNQYFEKEKGSKDSYILHACEHGFFEAVVPIHVEGKCIAQIVKGPFFFKKPDSEHFRNQAKKWSFYEEEYLKALTKVPIISKEKIDLIMNFYIQFAQTLVEMGLAKLKEKECSQKAISDSEKYLYQIVRHTNHIPFQSYDISGRVRYWNDASEQLYGWTQEEAQGKTLDELIFDKLSADEFKRKIEYVDDDFKVFGPIECKCRTKDGENKVVLSTVFPMKIPCGEKVIINIDLDITEKKKLEQELIRFDKLSLVGEMAASIGHEIRNPMTTVRGFLQLLKNKEDCVKYKRYFNLMMEEIDRANSIIVEFLNLAKNKNISLQNLNINDVVIAITPLIEANALLNNQIVKIQLSKTKNVLLDEKEIRQLILNLVHNGLEAMSPGNELTIRTYMDGKDVVLTVEDQGTGIETHILDKLGTPFLSTKDNGTGLGLAVCYSIAARHNAKIEVETGQNGTTFYVRFTTQENELDDE